MIWHYVSPLYLKGKLDVSTYISALLKYLSRVSPEQWHQIAWNWNQDSGIEPLKWIIRQSSCDKGTALLIYWNMAPRYLYQFATREAVPEYFHEEYDVIKEIEERYLSGYYAQQNFSFDPTNDEDINWTTKYNELAPMQRIPEEMFSPTPGTKLKRIDIPEGMPQEIIDEVDG